MEKEDEREVEGGERRRSLEGGKEKGREKEIVPI